MENLIEEVEGARGEMNEERLAEEADIAIDSMDVEREWLREEEDRADAAMKKVAVVKPFFNNFENLSPRKRTYLLTRMFQKDRADAEEQRSRCHKVINYAEKEFERQLLTETDAAFVRVINEHSEDQRCEKCAHVMQEGECHCHLYFCKRCHSDKVCGRCNKIFAYPPEIFQFQYFFHNCQ